MRTILSLGIAALIITLQSCNGSGSGGGATIDTLAVVRAYQQMQLTAGNDTSYPRYQFYTKKAMDAFTKHAKDSIAKINQILVELPGPLALQFMDDYKKFRLPLYRLQAPQRGTPIEGFVMDLADFNKISCDTSIKTIGAFFGVNGQDTLTIGGRLTITPRYTLIIRAIKKDQTKGPGDDFYDFVDPCPGGANCP